MADHLGAARRRRSIPEPIRGRLTLLSLTISVGRIAFTELALLWVAAALVVPASAIALGALVGRVAELADQAGRVRAGALTGPVVAVAALFLAVVVVERFLRVARARLVTRVEARIDATARGADAAVKRSPDPSGPRELVPVAARATSGGRMFGLASATDAQLWLFAHYVGGIACAVLLARFSIPAAACALLASVWQRELLRRSFAVPYAAEAETVLAADRAATYWRHVASTPAAARDVRVFDMAGWVIAEHACEDAASVRSIASMLERAVPRLWASWVLMSVGAGVSFVILGHAAVVGQRSVGELVVALGATLGTLRLGSLGEEAFPLEAAPARLTALRALERGSAS